MTSTTPLLRWMATSTIFRALLAMSAIIFALSSSVLFGIIALTVLVIVLIDAQTVRIVAFVVGAGTAISAFGNFGLKGVLLSAVVTGAALLLIRTLKK